MLLYGVGGTTQLPIGGWYLLFSMGRVKSGWLSKFWCIPVLFQMVLNGLDITGSHLLDTQWLESSFVELLARMFAEIPGPSTLGWYNVHNVLAGSNILFGIVLLG